MPSDLTDDLEHDHISNYEVSDDYAEKHLRKTTVPDRPVTIVVTYDNAILGSGEFWRGPAESINEIRNLPARWLAEKVATDGRERKDGMWTVKVAPNA